MVIRGTDGELYWQDLDTGNIEPYTGQDGGTTAGPVAGGTDEGALRIGAGLGGGGLAGPSDPVPSEPEPFDPNKHPITKTVKLAGGTQYHYTDSNGQTQVTFVPDTKATTGATGGVTANQSAVLAANKAAADQAQSNWQSTQDMERAKYNQNYALDQGKTLLGLGSRPDTLIKYLYALRGQQTPQALNGTTTNLPGFQNVVGQPNPQQPGGQPGAPGAGVPGVASPTNFGNNRPAGTQLIPGTPYVGVPGAGVPVNDSASGGMTIPGTNMTQGRSSTFDNAAMVKQALGPGISIGLANGTGPTATPALQIGGGTPVPPGVTEDPTYQVFRQNVADNIVKGQVSTQQQADGPKAIGPGGIAIYKEGGLIPEPVMGIGMHSGQHYMFGEAGPEHVVPGKGHKPAPPLHGQNSYADGGTIGYDPTNSSGRMTTTATYGTGSGTETPVDYAPGVEPSTLLGTGGSISPLSSPTNIFGGQSTSGPGTYGRYASPMGFGMGSAPAGGNASAPIAPISSNVFNPPDLRNIVARGYNSSPNTPFFPQIGIATNGGQSLIPSAQRLNALTPTEQGLYSGALQDEFGVMPEDVFSMARQLAPHISGLHTPRFAN